MESIRGKRLVIFGCGYVGTAVAREARERDTRGGAHAQSRPRGGTGRVGRLPWWRSRDGYLAPSASRRARSSCSIASVREAGELQSTGDPMLRDAIDSRLGGAQLPRALSSTPAAHRLYPQTGGMVVDETAPTEGAGANGRILLEAEALLQKSGPGVRSMVHPAVGSNVFRAALLDHDPGGRGDGWKRRAAPQSGSPRRHRGGHWAAFMSPAAGGNRIFNVADDAAATKSKVGGVAGARLAGRLRASPVARPAHAAVLLSRRTV